MTLVYYFYLFWVVAIPTGIVWVLLKDSEFLSYLALLTVVKVFRYSDEEKMEGKKLKTMEALLMLFHNVIPLTLGLTLGIFTFFAFRGDYEYIDVEGLMESCFLAYGVLAGSYYGIKLIHDIPRHYIFIRFFSDWYFDVWLKTKISKVYSFFMVYIIPTTLAISFGIFWYLEGMGITAFIE